MLKDQFQSMMRPEQEEMTMEEKLEAERMSREFWNTRFTRKFSTFGSEPRGKVARQAPGTRVDDGYTQWGYAKTWTQKDKGINAINPRVMLAQTFGVLVTGPPGPGEYSGVSKAFEKTSHYSNDGVYTVKGREEPVERFVPTKTPVDLLSFAAKDSGKVPKRSKKAKPLGAVTLSGTRVNGKAIEHLSEEQLRTEIKKYGQMPGPNSYAEVDTPYRNYTVGRLEKWNCRAPAWSMHKPLGSPVRQQINFSDQSIFQGHQVPGPGAYNLGNPAGKDAVTAKIDPVPHLAKSSSKRLSHVGPGSYDVEKGFENTARMNKVAKFYMSTDMKKPAPRVNPLPPSRPHKRSGLL